MKSPRVAMMRFVAGSVLGILGFGQMGRAVADGRPAHLAWGLLLLLVGVGLALGTVAARRSPPPAPPR